MCGRFSLTSDEAILNERFKLAGGSEPYIPRYNCAPSQNLVVITGQKPLQKQYFRWGLIPFWAKDAKIGSKLINARAENIADKPSFRNAFRQRRCLVPADGFYEWKKRNGKAPYRIVLKRNQLFAMAGIWEAWNSPEGKTIFCFSIITTTANEGMRDIHERMPVILPPGSEKLWIESNDTDLLQQLLVPYSWDFMDAYEVSGLVNSPRNDIPTLINPVNLR